MLTYRIAHVQDGMEMWRKRIEKWAWLQWWKEACPGKGNFCFSYFSKLTSLCICKESKIVRIINIVVGLSYVFVVLEAIYILCCIFLGKP